ncbi:MAG: multicopper oxidase family protein, partial [bacterium]|nr:multicopper oxidase family protein [bacterium]
DRSFNNNAPWIALGGDFALLASATATIPPRGEAIWDSATNPAMVADVQMWLDDPAMNFGWIVIGDETRISTTRRFDSREGAAPPLLVVTIAGGEPCCDDTEFGTCAEVPTGTCQNPPPGPADSCDPNPCPQPKGACCNADESCSDNIPAEDCRTSGGTFNGAGSQCSDSPVNCGLEPFVDALPWPVPVAQPVSGPIGGEASYEINMTEVRQQLHRDLPDTTVWGYNGSYPGPTLETTVGHPIRVKWINDLPPSGHYLSVDTCPHGPNYWRGSSRTVVHLHGGHVPARVDGQPEFDFMPGEFDTYVYPNNQMPATLWYHDHSLGITRLNVYMGLAAYYLIRPDCSVTPTHPECNGSLPGKEFEVPAVIQDRVFNADGSLSYPTTVVGGGFLGDKVLVNGKVWPFLNVKQGKYRFRFINGSQARAYTLRLENLADPAQVIPFTLIGTDVGLVSAPISLNTIHAVPAERFDVVIDFARFPAGTEIVLRNDETTGPRLPNVMKFLVMGEPGHTGDLPATLTPVSPMPEDQAVATRWFNLVKVAEQCAGSEWLIQSLDGPDPATANVLGEHWDDISEFPVKDQTEIWEFINASDMMHPMHVHLVKFQVLDRCPLGGGPCEPLAPHELNTWKDTVRVSPGERVRVIMKFEDYVGKYAYHCHLLDHEDHEMMRQLQVTHDPALCNNNGICEADEDCESCPTDCAKVSGALCGNKLCETGDGEDFITCPADCAGSDSGGTPFNCGSTDPADPGYKCGFALFPDGKPNFSEVLFDGCVTNGFFCRVKARVPACCGDALCEGQETSATCGNDCKVAVDLDIARFRVPKSVKLGKAIKRIQLTVENPNGGGEDKRMATLVGVQNGTEVYRETRMVFDLAGNGRSRFGFSPYAPTAVGTINWTVTIADDDPDQDIATATTVVR